MTHVLAACYISKNEMEMEMEIKWNAHSFNEKVVCKKVVLHCSKNGRKFLQKVIL